MKNVFLVPTDKPSRLVKFFSSKYHLCKEILPIQEEEQYQNIYITNDEEIKEGDWFIYKDEVIHRDKGKIDSIWIDAVKNGKKIILTTDQDLIKDGIQAIGDEFLEWFVKNPSCEEVEVESNKCLVKRGQCSCSYQDIDCQCSGYKIIIPKEEYKQREIFLMNANTVIDTRKPKQETLEEAIKQQFKYDNLQYAKEISSRIKVDSYPDIDNKETLENFIKSIYPSPSGGKIRGIELGAKWQAERMYSEEEVYHILCEHTAELFKGSKLSLTEWFKKFKK